MSFYELLRIVFTKTVFVILNVLIQKMITVKTSRKTFLYFEGIKRLNSVDVLTFLRFTSCSLPSWRSTWRRPRGRCHTDREPEEARCQQETSPWRQQQLHFTNIYIKNLQKRIILDDFLLWSILTSKHWPFWTDTRPARTWNRSARSPSDQNNRTDCKKWLQIISIISILCSICSADWLSISWTICDQLIERWLCHLLNS